MSARIRELSKASVVGFPNTTTDKVRNSFSNESDGVTVQDAMTEYIYDKKEEIVQANEETEKLQTRTQVSEEEENECQKLYNKKQQIGSPNVSEALTSPQQTPTTVQPGKNRTIVNRTPKGPFTNATCTNGNPSNTQALPICQAQASQKRDCHLLRSPTYPAGLAESSNETMPSCLPQSLQPSAPNQLKSVNEKSADVKHTEGVTVVPVQKKEQANNKSADVDNKNNSRTVSRVKKRRKRTYCPNDLDMNKIVDCLHLLEEKVWFFLKVRSHFRKDTTELTSFGKKFHDRTMMPVCRCLLNHFNGDIEAFCSFWRDSFKLNFRDCCCAGKKELPCRKPGPDPI